MGGAPDVQPVPQEADAAPPPQAEGPVAGEESMNTTAEAPPLDERWGIVFYRNMSGDATRSLDWEGLPEPVRASVCNGIAAVLKQACLQHDRLSEAVLSDEYPCPGHHCEQSWDEDCDAGDVRTVVDPSSMEGQVVLQQPCPTWRDDCPKTITVRIEWDGDEYQSFSYPVAEGDCTALIEHLNENVEHPFWMAYHERARLASLIKGAQIIDI
jgi:hypothetical protein